MKTIIPIFAATIISVAGIIYKNRMKVALWMKQRRIDKLPERDPFKCGVCGAPMKIKKRYTGTQAGKEMLVCSNYPECRKVEWM